MKTTMSHLKRITVVFMATTIALAGMAVGYGLWQSTIDIKVTTTATVGEFVCFGFTQLTIDDSGPPGFQSVLDHTIASPIYFNVADTVNGYRTFGYPPGVSPTPSTPINPGEVPKDVGWTTGQIFDEDQQCAGESVEISLHNVYPSYASFTSVSFINVGPNTAVTITEEGISLPAEMTSAGYYLKYYSPPGAAVLDSIQHTKCYWLYQKVTGPTPTLPNDLQDPMDGPGGFTSEGDGADNDADGAIDEDVAVLDLCWENYEGAVLSPGEPTLGGLKVHVLQPAAQDAEYKFHVWVVVWPS